MTDYKKLISDFIAVSFGIENIVSIMANASALIWENLSDLNWAGFYVMNNGNLELGPFQGKVACTKIAVGRGVCGTAVLEDQTQLVKNVHEFKGHIACDSLSNSEIVVPIHKDRKVWGVLDIDSPVFDRFSLEDKAGLENFVSALEGLLKDLTFVRPL